MKAVFKKGAKEQCLEWLTSSLEGLKSRFSKEEKLALINMVIGSGRFDVVGRPGTYPISMIVPSETLSKLRGHSGRFPLKEEWIDFVKSKVEEDYIDKVKELL
jgi:hypothetical protein